MEQPQEFKLPETLAACADLYYATRQERLRIDKLVAELKSREETLKSHLIEKLPESGATGVAGQLCRIGIVNKQEPMVEDWDAFYKYVAKRKAWDMLQRRISPAAIKARWEEKKVVDGVVAFPVTTISCNKV